MSFYTSETDTRGSAQTRDISAKGVGFVTDIRLQPHASIEMWISIPDKREPLYLKARVIWSIPTGDGSFRIGAELETVDFIGVARALRASIT